MTKSANRMLNKLLWREVATLGLYWFTQPELRLVLLYTIVKGSTNQSLITKHVFCLVTPNFTNCLNTTFGTILDSL